MNKCKNGVTMRSRPKDAALAATRFQSFTRVINGDLSNRCTSDSGAMATLATAHMSYVAVASGILAVLVPMLESTVSSSATEGVATLRAVSYSALTYTIMGRLPRQMSLTNARTVLSSRVAYVNDGVT